MLKNRDMRKRKTQSTPAETSLYNVMSAINDRDIEIRKQSELIENLKHSVNDLNRELKNKKIIIGELRKEIISYCGPAYAKPRNQKLISLNKDGSFKSITDFDSGKTIHVGRPELPLPRPPKNNPPKLKLEGISNNQFLMFWIVVLFMAQILFNIAVYVNTELIIDFFITR